MKKRKNEKIHLSEFYFNLFITQEHSFECLHEEKID